MPRFAWVLLLQQLAATPLRADDYTGQVGRIDTAQLDVNWFRLRPSEFPIIPLEGVTVSVLGCVSILPSAPGAIRSASPWSRVKSNAHPGPARPSVRSGLRELRTSCCATCRPSLNEGVYALEYLLHPAPPPKQSIIKPAGFQ